MSDLLALAAYLREYMSLLQVAAVTGVACVLITNAASDMFATEPSGSEELGSGLPVQAQKYRGFIADTCRVFVFAVSGILAIAYSTMLIAIISSTLAIAVGTGCNDLMPLETSKAIRSTSLIVDAAASDSGQPTAVSPEQDCLAQRVMQRLPWTASQLKSGIFRPSPLRTEFIIVVSVTIVAACWIAFLATILRWMYMRRPRAA